MIKCNLAMELFWAVAPWTGKEFEKKERLWRISSLSRSADGSDSIADEKTFGRVDFVWKFIF